MSQAETILSETVPTINPERASGLRFYAACLASYNNGRLYGAWIGASDDVDAMQKAVDAMLRASPCPNVMVEHDGKSVSSAEEYAVHDYDGAWPSTMGEYPGLDGIAAWAAVIEAADDADIPHEAAKELAAHYGESSDFVETLEAMADRYEGEHDTLTEYAEAYVESAGMLDGVNATVAQYFDFEAFGRDLRLGGDVFTIDASGSLHVFRSC